MKNMVIGMLLLWMVSCDKTGSNINYLEGTYIGYFHRSSRDTSEVSIKFSSDNYEGKTSKQFYPILCMGSFDQSENTISFHDSCFQFRAPDTTLVLKGKFQYEFNNDGTLRIWRQRGVVTDEYILRKSLR